MFDKTKKILTSKNAKHLVDVRNLGLYIFGIVVLAIAWSGAKTVQSNYELQKKISRIQQENTVLGLVNQNIGLQNEYYKTNEYLDLSARQNLGLATPGEKVLIVPKQTAQKYVSEVVSHPPSQSKLAIDNRPGYIKNLESWRDFLLGRKSNIQ